ncbi:MAG: acyltransferase [Bacteroidales bacterium]|nr:acyltransferase [Bacteroidales bacterium]
MPERGNWDGKSRGGRAGYLIFIFFTRHFGIGAAYALLAFVVTYFILFAPKATRASWRYHRRRLHLGIFRSLTGIYANMYSFGQAIIDRICIKSGLAGKFEFVYDDRERAMELSRLPGAILLSDHIGSWEIAGNFFGGNGMKVNVVLFDNEDKKVREAVGTVVKEELPYTPIVMNEDPLGAMLAIKVALNRGEFVCINGERYVDANSAVEREMLGGKVLMPAGPYRIASRCRVPVLFFHAVREKGRRYRLIIEENSPEDCADSDVLMGNFIASMERVLASFPDQWFNFYDFWV